MGSRRIKACGSLATPLLGFVASVACSSEPTTAGSAGSGGGIVADAGGDAPSGSGGAAGNTDGCGSDRECTAPGHAGPVEPMFVDAVFARLVDMDDNPALVQATVCGTNVCIYGETDAEGNAVMCDRNGVCLPGIQPGLEIYKPAFKYGTGIDFAELAWPLAPGQTSWELGTVYAVRFPPLGTGAPLACGGEASSGGLTLRFAADTRIEIDDIVFKTPEQQALRAVAIPPDRAPQAFDATLGFEIMFVATPVNTTFCPPAELTTDNTAGWPPNTAVEVFVHGLDTTEQWAPFGGWAKVSDGAVSSDGALVQTNAEGGLPMLSAIGIRRKP